MRLYALGHSSFIVEMDAPDGAPVRILVDPWFTDHLAGDLSERFPRVRFDPNVLLPLDGIFISHAHTDHLDPYSLVQLWSEASFRPRLFLPQSLLYLDSLLREHLEDVDIHYFHDCETVAIRGVEVAGVFNPERRATNEDDVMMLVLRTERETFIGEADAEFPFYDLDARAELSETLGVATAESVVFLTTENEGDATMAMFDAQDLEEREALLSEHLERTYESAHSKYTPTEENDDLWGSPNVVRLIGGQGIAFPREVDGRWNRVLFPIRLRDRVTIERDVAAQNGCQHTIEEFVPGEAYDVSGGKISTITPLVGFEVLDTEDDRDYDEELELFENFPVAPLQDEARDTELQYTAILNCLNVRFLPHLIGARRPPVEHLLAGSGGRYTVRVRFGTTASYADRDFTISFATLRFTETDAGGEPNEWYWANDLDDVFSGKADEFSTICRRPLGGTAQRLWSCLGLPYLNNDLVERKLKFHFELARAGKSAGEWVLPFYGLKP